MTKMKQEAIFGEGSYKITDRVKATVGVGRYSCTQGGTCNAYGIVVGTLTPTPKEVVGSNSSPTYQLDVGTGRTICESLINDTLIREMFAVVETSRPIVMSNAICGRPVQGSDSIGNVRRLIS